ncbi:hypothetical protein CEXT_806921 [Caerostris extrusa]|uniref:Uncharacterized protein n=1 Tax=Caerostris extrusa TaxID=172846 RepID=A0AAV4P7E0_CAEEX|nr:hypothetical protein CEXT_806921 [Caerostris extrusa]
MRVLTTSFFALPAHIFPEDRGSAHNKRFAILNGDNREFISRHGDFQVIRNMKSNEISGIHFEARGFPSYWNKGKNAMGHVTFRFSFVEQKATGGS